MSFGLDARERAAIHLAIALALIPCGTACRSFRPAQVPSFAAAHRVDAGDWPCRRAERPAKSVLPD
ncbi:MAG: hypothetical protein IPH06_13780 [Alphaproteobacteria bacterium]|nr:hypothetical protein [Alphaproteobacteria bacterium]